MNDWRPLHWSCNSSIAALPVSGRKCPLTLTAWPTVNCKVDQAVFWSLKAIPMKWRSRLFQWRRHICAITYSTRVLVNIHYTIKRIVSDHLLKSSSGLWISDRWSLVSVLFWSWTYTKSFLHSGPPANCSTHSRQVLMLWYNLSIVRCMLYCFWHVSVMSFQTQHE